MAAGNVKEAAYGDASSCSSSRWMFRQSQFTTAVHLESEHRGTFSSLGARHFSPVTIKALWQLSYTASTAVKSSYSSDAKDYAEFIVLFVPLVLFWVNHWRSWQSNWIIESCWSYFRFSLIKIPQGTKFSELKQVKIKKKCGYDWWSLSSSSFRLV